MTQTQKIFVELIKSAIKKETFSCGEEIDWQKVYALACAHNLSTAVYYAIVENKLPIEDEQMELIGSHFLMCIKQLYNQIHSSGIICAEFEKSKIKYMPLKGFVIRDLYPQKEMRLSCDIDIFYDSDKTDEVNRIMKEKGFAEDEKGENHYSYVKNDVCFEMHYLLTPPNEFLNNYYKDVWSRLKKCGDYKYEFSNEDFYIYYMLHFIKHFINGGGGMRAMADIYLYNEKVNTDKEFLKNEFEKLGIFKFVETMEKCARYFFAEEEADKDIEKVCEYIINQSSFGSDSISLSSKYGGENGFGTKSRYFLYRTFPPKAKMKNLYPALEKSPYLLPVFYPVRWFDILFSRKERVTRVINIMKNAENKETAGDILKIVGLEENKHNFY